MLRRMVVCVVFLGCGFQSRAGSEADAAAAVDAASIDAAPVDTPDGPTDCLGHWGDGSLAISMPKELTSLSTTGAERDAWISRDGQTLYYAGALAGGTSDIWRAQLTGTGFGQPMRLIDLSVAGQSDDRPALTGDQNTIVLASDRTGDRARIFTNTRPSGGEFALPNEDHLGNVNATDANNYDPFLTADGLTLYWAPALTGGHQQIWFAERADVSSDFVVKNAVPGINNVTSADNADPALSLDGHILVFTSNRAGGDDLNDLWYATRPGPTGPFGVPKHIPTVNSGTDDGDPMLSADGCQLYFASRRRDGHYHLWMAQVAR